MFLYYYIYYHIQIIPCKVSNYTMHCVSLRLRERVFGIMLSC